MATTVPMLAPDGTSGDIPSARVQDALKAGFKPAAPMVSPDGKNGYIPIDQVGNARNAGFKDQEQQQPGFWENLGHTLGIGSQEDAQRLADFKAHPIQSLAMAAAGPAGQLAKTAYSLIKSSSGELGQAQSSMLEGNAPAAAVHAIQAVPIVGPAVSKMADEAPAAHPGQSYASQVLAGATPGNIGTAVGTAAQVAPMVLGAADAAAPTRPVIPNPPVPASMTDAASALHTTASRLFPSFIDGSPEDLMTRAIKPGKNNANWNTDAPVALSLMKSAEEQLGHPVAGIDDALEANALAKKAIWQQYQQRLGPAAQMGATIDGNQIADAMMNSLDTRTALQNPGLVAKTKAVADTYRRPLQLDEAEDFLQSTNKDLNTYYAKNKVGQNVALNDPDISSTVAEGQALRQALYSKLDDLSGPGAAQLKQAYGSLSNVEKELTGRQLVAARQNVDSLAEQMSTARGVGKIAKGVLTMSPGDVLEGSQNIAVSRALKARNTSDAMITRAFEAAQPAQPFPMPTSPRLAGLLQRGPIPMGGPPEAGGTPAGYVPPPVAAGSAASRLGRMLPAQSGAPVILPPDAAAMSGGERIAALMQMLRRNPQLKLPAQAQPIQLPPPQQ